MLRRPSVQVYANQKNGIIALDQTDTKLTVHTGEETAK
jgi:hypothetical protein